MDALRAAEHVAVAPPPRPLIEPGGRRLTLTPAMLVAGLVVLVIVAFVGYIGFQLLRYAATTPITLTNPTNVVSEVDSQSIVLSGTSASGAAIVITGPGGKGYNTTADEHGAWSREVDLGLGRNDFSIVSIDPVTQRRSDPPLALTINVPLPQSSSSSGASATPPPPAVLTLDLVGPTDGEASTDGQIVVRGTTTAERLTITSAYLGAYNSTPAPSGEPSASPGASSTPSASGSPAPIGPAREVIVSSDGNFAEGLNFPLGRWRLTITAYRSGLDPVIQIRDVVVTPALASALNVMLQVEVHKAWVRIVADGSTVAGYGGKTLHPGDTVNVTASDQVCIRSGNAGAVHVFVNDMDLGSLGSNGQVGNWLITREQPQPEPIDRAC